MVRSQQAADVAAQVVELIASQEEKETSILLPRVAGGGSRCDLDFDLGSTDVPKAQRCSNRGATHCDERRSHCTPAVQDLDATGGVECLQRSAVLGRRGRSRPTPFQEGLPWR